MSRIGLQKRELWLIILLFGLMVAIIGIKNIKFNKNTSTSLENSFGVFNVFIRNVADSNMLFVPAGHFEADSVIIERIMGETTGTNLRFIDKNDNEEMSLSMRFDLPLDAYLHKNELMVKSVDSNATKFIGAENNDSSVVMKLDFLINQSVNLGLRSEVITENSRVELRVNRFDSLASLDIRIKSQSSFWQTSYYGGIYMVTANFSFKNVKVGKRIVN